MCGICSTLTVVDVVLVFLLLTLYRFLISPCSDVSIVDFEQVNTSWVITNIITFVVTINNSDHQYNSHFLKMLLL